jgi:2,3-bisphosphoglycerate-dependent phosphoglycerate mutase
MRQDVPLSETGEREALDAAHQLSTYLYDIDACFTSTLDRAQATSRACLERLSTQPKTIIEDYRLCERHYGEPSLLF